MVVRSKDYENKFKSYLFKGDSKRFKAICRDIGVVANLKVLSEVVE